jgi:hypothetical protein
MGVCQRATRVAELLLGVIALGCAGANATPPQAGAADGDMTASTASLGKLETGGWEDLLPSPDLRGFRRVPLDPLADKLVWQVRSDGTLFIDGVGAKEMLLSERELGDGVLHVEWRFVPAAAPAMPGAATPASAAPVYNGGVYVRTPLDGKSWVQLQVSHADKPPIVGDLIAQVPGQAERVDVFQTQPSAAAPIGDWNAYDINLRGASIELSVNGKPAAAWPACPFSRGHVGLQAEGSPIEVRAFQYRPL